MRAIKTRFWQAGGRAAILRFAPIMAIGVALGLLVISGAYRRLSLEEFLNHRAMLQDLVHGYGWVGVGGFIGMYAGLMAIGAPGAPLMAMLAGALFGPWLGVPITISSVTLGGALFFMAVKLSVNSFQVARGGEKAKRLSRALQNNAICIMLFFRLSPMFPFPLVNVAAALAGLRLWLFVWTTLVGLFPAAVIYNIAGMGLDQLTQEALADRARCLALADQAPVTSDCALAISYSSILSFWPLSALLGLSVLTLAPILWRYRQWIGIHAKTDD